MVFQSLFGFIDPSLEARYRDKLSAQIKPWLLVEALMPWLNLISLALRTDSSLNNNDLIIIVSWSACILCLAHSRIQKGYTAVTSIVGFYSITLLVAAWSSHHRAERFIINSK